MRSACPSLAVPAEDSVAFRALPAVFARAGCCNPKLKVLGSTSAQALGEVQRRSLWWVWGKPPCYPFPRTFSLRRVSAVSARGRSARCRPRRAPARPPDRVPSRRACRTSRADACLRRAPGAGTRGRPREVAGRPVVAARRRQREQRFGCIGVAARDDLRVEVAADHHRPGPGIGVQRIEQRTASAARGQPPSVRLSRCTEQATRRIPPAWKMAAIAMRLPMRR